MTTVHNYTKYNSWDSIKQENPSRVYLKSKKKDGVLYYELNETRHPRLKKMKHLVKDIFSNQSHKHGKHAIKLCEDKQFTLGTSKKISISSSISESKQNSSLLEKEMTPPVEVSPQEQEVPKTEESPATKDISTQKPSVSQNQPDSTDMLLWGIGSFFSPQNIYALSTTLGSLF